MTTFSAKHFQAILDRTTLLKDYIDAPYITASESFDDENELREYLQERISEAEIVYYHNAAKFLLQ